MICCVTGHRPNGFPFERNDDNPLFIFYKDELTNMIQKLVDEGYNHFISGMADGADIDFMLAVVNLRNKSKISLEAAMPCPYASKKEMLSFCDKVTVVSDHYFKGCMQKRNKYMVDQSNIVIAIWNGKSSGGTWNTIRYAKSKNKKILYINLCDIYQNKP